MSSVESWDPLLISPIKIQFSDAEEMQLKGRRQVKVGPYSFKNEHIVQNKPFTDVAYKAYKTIQNLAL